MTTAFPGAEITAFAARATDREKALFAIGSAQRAVIVAVNALGTLTAEDHDVLLDALHTAWAATPDDDGATLSKLMGRLVDEDDPAYSFYHSAVNDALTATIYAVRAGHPNAGGANVFHAAQTFFNIADLIAQRGMDSYPSDPSAQPVLGYAAKCLREDLVRVPRIAADNGMQAYRDICISEAQHLTRLGDS